MFMLDKEITAKKKDEFEIIVMPMKKKGNGGKEGLKS